MTDTSLLSRQEKVSYGFGDFACGLYWQAFMAYLTFYYTDVFGLTPLAAGTLLGLSRSIDAAIDPVLGLLADRTRTRWGRFRPYVGGLCVPLALAGVLTFTTPDLGDSGKLIWAWATFNLLMLIYSAINIPYTALLASLTPDPQERTALSSVRFVGAFAAAVLVSASLLPLCRALGGNDVARGWQLAFAVYGAVAVVSLAITFRSTRERVTPLLSRQSSVGRDLRDLLQNGPWLMLLAASLLSTLVVAVRSSITAHYFKYYVGEQSVALPELFAGVGGHHAWPFETLLSAFNTCTQIAALFGVLVLPWVTAAFDRKSILIAMYVVTLACSAGFYLIPPESVALMFSVNCLAALAGGPMSALLWGMYADTVDYSEWKTGRRSAGLVFSVLIFMSKQGWAAGAALTLVVLSHAGFVANSGQTPESREALRELMSVIPAAIGALALIPLCLYPLGDARVAAIGAELQRRRQTALAD